VIYYCKRVLYCVPLLLAISFLSFGLVRLAPGGPFDKERTPASPEIERQRFFHAGTIPMRIACG
jgi:ABC-type microcin C transport system permease subunit YejB